jgi:hypothetical protein
MFQSSCDENHNAQMGWAAVQGSRQEQGRSLPVADYQVRGDLQIYTDYDEFMWETPKQLS